MRFGLFGSAQAKRGGRAGRHPRLAVAGPARFRDRHGIPLPRIRRLLAAQGGKLLLDQYASIGEIGERIALFKSEVEKQGRPFDPMSVGVTRSINVVDTATELQKAAKRVISDEAICAGALYGTPDAIAVKLEVLRAAGAEYVLLNSAGGPPSLRRFAHEVRPAFADAATLQPV